METEIERHKVLDRKQEEILKSKVVNHATFLYLQEELDGVAKRKDEEKLLISDFLSDRQAF